MIRIRLQCSKLGAFFDPIHSILIITFYSLPKNLVVTPIDLLMVKFTFYKRSNNLIVHLFAFR
ncbi:hypothetical protein ACUHZR_18545, partial [Photobacterium damselae subsp. piscicida]|uniref:hypothetical protein n=1 Tax=Photobacterium damselae TaxID=38293 RepID=UPI0040409D20